MAERNSPQVSKTTTAGLSNCLSNPSHRCSASVVSLHRPRGAEIRSTAASTATALITGVSILRFRPHVCPLFRITSPHGVAFVKTLDLYQIYYAKKCTSAYKSLVHASRRILTLPTLPPYPYITPSVRPRHGNFLPRSTQESRGPPGEGHKTSHTPSNSARGSPTVRANPSCVNCYASLTYPAALSQPPKPSSKAGRLPKTS